MRNITFSNNKKWKQVTSATTTTKKKININDFVVNKILVSKNKQYGKYNSFKYFIGYNDDNVIRPLGEGFA